MEKPVKIFELSGEKFLKGLSMQTEFPFGGLFKRADGFDPFELAGYLQGSLQATELTAPVGSVKTLTTWQASGVGYVYAHTPTKLYQYLRASPYTQTDVTSSVTINDGSGGTISGSIIYRNRYVYAEGTNVYVSSLPVGTEKQLWNNDGGQPTADHPFVIAPDANLYMATGNLIVPALTTTTNLGTISAAGQASAVFKLDDDMVIRDVLTDGKYMIMIADNNVVIPANRVTGDYKCRVYFWDLDTTRTTSNQIWDIKASYLIGAEYQDGAVTVFADNGIYVCNVSTAPRMILDATGNSSILALPSSPYQITSGKGSIYWPDSRANGQNVYAYGNLPGMKNKIFYTPYITHQSTYKHTALLFSAGVLFAAVDAPKLYIHNIGSTRGSVTLQTTPIILPQTYQLNYVKVSLKKSLASGQAVAVKSFNANGDIISETETKSYAAANARKNLKFTVTATAGSNPRFEDYYVQVNPQAGAIVSRVSVYATPQDDSSQDL